MLPPRGQRRTVENDRLWRVTGFEQQTEARTAKLVALDDSDVTTASAADALVVVAEFRDPIYPGLVSTGKVERGGDKPFHTVVNAENFHALQTLLFTNRGNVDCIYIDPPYNTGAKDWKYNNDYVEGDDHYRHSKWLAFMERRLLLARELLNPDDSVLIVTIDEKEYLRLGLLLEQTFPDSDVQMVTSVISAKGAVRQGKFSRVEEHVFFVPIGAASVEPWSRNMLNLLKNDGAETQVEWLGLRRREPTSVRGARPNQFYPIFVYRESGLLHSIGSPVPDDVPREEVAVPEGATPLWPLKPDGTEMLWGLTPDVLRRNWERGFARVNRWDPEQLSGTVQYLPGGTIDMIEDGSIVVTGRAKDGSVQGILADGDDSPPPKRVWNMPSHNSETGGTKILSSLIPGRRFPYPKSLYAVEDALRFVVARKPTAVVLDFFAGSGTTAHAVMRLNRQDGGSRRAILVTNNEVAAAEQDSLVSRGLRPGDAEWEANGICDYLTKPRVQAAISGVAHNGKPVSGSYRFTDEFPLAEGFEENAEFFTLTYEAPLRVASHREFKKVAALLWMRAGSRGRRIEDLALGWDVSETYGVIADFDKSEEFLAAVTADEQVSTVFIVTDEDRLFESTVAELPDHADPVRLYESYLRNFELEAGRSLQ